MRFEIKRKDCTEKTRPVKNIVMHGIDSKTVSLTLTRPIGLPPHAPVAQKSADQR